MYADVEQLLVGWMPTVITPAPRVSNETPADPAGTYAWVANGFVKVNRIGGISRYGIDTARVNVECFGATYAAAAALSNQVRVAVETRLIGASLSAAAVVDTATTSAPSWVPYDDVNVTRFLGSYTLTVHSK